MEGEKEKEALPPDDLRCKRTDGRDWRCKRPALPGKSLCEPHLHRSSQKKPKKKSSDKNKPDGNSNSAPLPRVRIRVRVKPEPTDDTPPAASDAARDAEVVVPENLRCQKNDGRSWQCGRQVLEGQTLCEVHVPKIKVKGPTFNPTPTMRAPPRKKKKVVVDDEVEGREKGPTSTSTPSSTTMRAPPRVVDGDVEERDNNNDGDDNVVVGLGVSRCKRNSGRGWRCENPAKQGYSMCESHLNNAKIKRNSNNKTEKPKPVRKPNTAKPSVAAVAAENVAGEDEDVGGGCLPDNLRCTRNDGRDWRCKRRVLEGQTLCEAHFKKVKLKDVEVKGVTNELKRKRKRSSKSRNDSEVVVKVEPEEEVGNQLAMVAAVAVAEGEREREMEEELRCKRTDGRGWRCKRKVLDGKTLCEIHYEQGRLRQKRITVPESMKIQRGDSGDRIEKKLKRKRALEILESNSDKGMKRMKAELIRVFLRREIIEQHKKSEKGSGSSNSNAGGEVTRDLPYGLMAIPPAPPAQFLDNAGSLGIKVGVHCSNNSLVTRRFRSKNIEPPPISTLKAVPYAGNMGKVRNSGRRKCHWCRKSDEPSLTKCLSCKKRFFCSDCIKERYIDPEEVKVKCPVCRGSCDCKACCNTRSKDMDTKEILKENFKGSKYQQLQHLINLLLPILVHINQEQSIEVEMEAKFKGQDLSEVDIRQADVCCGDKCCCNNCKSPILDFHRSCPNCSYNLCLSCCREYTNGGHLGNTQNCSSKCPNRKETHVPGPKMCTEKIHMSSSTYSTDSADLAVTSLVPDSTPCLRISCPPMELGGCDNSLLDLRCIFPLNWTKELEISAKETASGHFSQTTDDSVPCTSCASINQAANKNQELQEASRRRGSHDNFLYCPSSSDDHHDVLTHFQKHWRKGHPVKVRNVLQCTSTLTWDPLAIFCSYLEDGPSKCVKRDNTIEAANCSDWYEVEFGSKEFFTPSLEEGCRHIRHETLKVKAKLSSAFSRRLLEGHYSEIIHSLPLQEYTNPRSGLLNIAGKLPEDHPDSKLGPHVCISFGSRVEVARGDLVTKLHYNSHDVVYILVHVGDAPCSTEQLNKVKKLIKCNTTKDKGDQISQNLENEETRMHSEISVEAGEQDRFLVGTNLSLGVAGASCCSGARDDESPVKLQSSDTDSDASMICSGTSDSPCKSTDQMSHLERLESSDLTDKRPSPEPCGAQWDVFRRQDIPKLLEYIRKHVDELSFSYDFPKNVVHPIFDGCFYLDATHKMQLKEEFDIEPWTFNQCLGEAVFIPAGCPYQMRNFKSCVNITLGFISPENASECIKLINEIRVLPSDHKAKQVKFEVEKMAICSIDEAIKELYRLRSEEGSHPGKAGLIPIASS